MARTTLDNVIATVGGESHTVSLTITDDGLVVGSFGMVPWAGSEMVTEVGAEGCTIHLSCPPGARTRYFVPASSFIPFGGVRVMGTFAMFLERAATAAGAQVGEPAPA